MGIFFVILFAVAAGWCFGWITKRFLLPMQPRWVRNLFIAIVVLVAIPCEAVFLLTASIPYQSQRLLDNAVSELENMLEKQLPGCTSQILSTEELRNTLGNMEEFNSLLSEYPEAESFAGKVGIASYSEYLESISENIDESLHEKIGLTAEQPITLHNIFTLAEQKCMPFIKKATKGIEIHILVVTAIILIVLCIVSLILSKILKIFFGSVEQHKQETEKELNIV